ncbi:hypothetical protein ACIQLJ_08165 [Microbacterium sp. NPDC091313]
MAAQDGDDRRRDDADRDKRRSGDRPPRRDSAGGAPRRPTGGAGAPRRDGDRRAPRRDDAGRPRRDDAGRPRRDDKGQPARRFGGGGERRGSPSSADRGGRPPARASRPPQGADERRAKSDDPVLPDDITPRDLAPAARNELKTLSKENAEVVARHLAMAARVIDEDPALAHAHALAASRRAGRIAVVRESAAITAYAIGDFALALRELRTYRRISGRDDQLALMVDSERGVGRPDRALELGRSVPREELPVPVRVELAIAMSGARLDLGEPERALQELDIPELDPDRAFEWSPGLFAARAVVLEELGRLEEAEQWQHRADVAAQALDAASGAAEGEELEIDDLDVDGDAAPTEPTE